MPCQINDGFLKENDKKYHFELSTERLKINGAYQAKDVRDRYLKFFEEKRGRRMIKGVTLVYGSDLD